MRFMPVLVPILLAAPLARAGNTARKEREARTACLAGDPARGVALLSELFVDTEDPNFIYNQGRCLEQNRRYEDAIGRFEEYLRVDGKITKAAKADAESHIADCERLLAKQKSQDAAAMPPSAPQAAPLPTPPTPIVSTAPAVVQQTNPQPVGKSGSGLRKVGIITATVGGAAVVAGVLFNIKANSLVSDMQKIDSYTSGKESDHSTYQTLSWVGYGVGAVCIAGGAVLYIRGLRADAPATTSVRLLPAFGPKQTSIALTGAF